jgi:hypothetical protein
MCFFGVPGVESRAFGGIGDGGADDEEGFGHDGSSCLAWCRQHRTMALYRNKYRILCNYLRLTEARQNLAKLLDHVVGTTSW